jgi:hypothetical protein
VSAGSPVTIAGREFELGAVYASVRSRKGNHPRRLRAYDPAYSWPDGRVEFETVPPADARGSWASRRSMSGRAWAAWAGEPVGDVGR